MPAANSSPATLFCSTPMELTSIKQYLQFFFIILSSRELMVMGSAVVFMVSILSSPT